MKLLSQNNAKTQKGYQIGWTTFVLSLAPGDLSGYEVCERRTVNCFKYCNTSTGNGRFPNVKNAKIERTKLFFEDRLTFMRILKGEIASAYLEYDKVAIRLNCFSDIRWEEEFQMDMFPEIQFYDYTKWSIMEDRKPTSNYHLTYSWGGYNMNECIKHLNMGYNVAVPYTGIMPDLWAGRPTIDGDVNDLRFRDGMGQVIMLKAKGMLRGKTNEFVFNY